jgi:putative glutamine amidotransferase
LNAIKKISNNQQMKKKQPIIGIPACVKTIGDLTFHTVGEKYINAVVDAADGLPLILPAIGAQQSIDRLVDLIDGLLLTGSPSNVDPERYGMPLYVSDDTLDKARDATTFPLIKAVLAAGKPLLGICRGFQELNVAFGGTLYQAVHNEANYFDHREKEGTIDLQYGPSHEVNILPNGYLHTILNGLSEITVNSLHGQGIDQLGNGLVVEAIAPDGLVEAISVKDSQQFTMAVQWHPEWKALINPHSMAIFKAFGDACCGINQVKENKHL